MNLRKEVAEYLNFSLLMETAFRQICEDFGLHPQVLPRMLSATGHKSGLVFKVSYRSDGVCIVTQKETIVVPLSGGFDAEYVSEIFNHSVIALAIALHLKEENFVRENTETT